MNNNTGFMGGLYMIAEWVMKFSVINLLWIAFNLPVAFIVLNMFFVDKIEGLIFFIIPLLIMLPFLFFPATTAMFAVVRDWIIKDADGHQLFKSYWRYYKENYKRSVANGFALTVAWLIMVVDIYYFFGENTMIMIFFIIMAIILFVFTVNLFSVTVHYRMTFLAAIKSAFLTTIGSPILFLTVAISSGIVLYMSLHVVRYLIPFLTVSLIAFLSFSAFYRNYLKVIEKVKNI